MTGLRNERGHSLVDVVAGIVLMSLVIMTLYHVFTPTFALSRNSSERLERQQDIRLAIDRVARDIHETAANRITTYAAGNGCSGTYQGCIAFVTPRPNCSGEFQLAGGFPNWQATVYIWRDVASNELRRRCDTGTTFPTGTWPPTLTPYTVIGTRIVDAAFTLQPAGSPTSLAIALREQTDAGSRPTRRYRTEFLNQTIFLPQNR